MFIQRLPLLLCALFFPLWAQAQEASQPDHPVCSVITVAPGDSLDALFGHTAIRIRDARLEEAFGTGDVWFDYGVFDPSDWTFWIHYAKGDAKYLLVAAQPKGRLAEYAKEGRQLMEQTLDLKPEEVVRLEDYLIENLRHPEYEYRFLDDNCTTRAVKAIEWARGKALESRSTGTYRNHTDLYLCRQPLVQLGANWLMGYHAEQPVRVFLPDQFHAAIAHAQTSSLETTSTLVSNLNAKAKELASANLTFTCVTAACFLLLALSTLYRHKKKIPLPTRAYLDALLFAKIGAIGCLMSFLGLWSHHPELGAFNWNLIWCWPTHLVFAFLLLFCAHGQTTRLYARIAAIGASCAALAYFFVPQALPVPLFPVVLLLALRAWRIGFHREAVIVPGQG